MYNDLSTRRPNYLAAAAFGTAGAVAAGALWYFSIVATHFEVGFIAAVVGIAVGKGVVHGAGMRSKSLIPIAAGITLVTLWFCEYLVDRHLASQYFAGQNMVITASFFDVGVMWDLVKVGLQDQPLTLLFWAFGLMAAVRQPMPTANDRPVIADPLDARYKEGEWPTSGSNVA